jgi:DNA topoisomerase-1
MGYKLVIVESPAKAKTIKKYLGSNFQVEASMGHVIDLPKSKLGVDIENNYEPKYITIRGKGELLDKLRKSAKKSDEVYLATDPDREGEAISWHLAKALKIDEKRKCRIEFNEITKSAVKKAIKNARAINENLVNAQQARRILDRLVGYEISPVLWKKVKWGLSAGRVQSASLKIICDREKEIQRFVSEEYWTVEAELVTNDPKSKVPLVVKLLQHKGKKLDIHNIDECEKILCDIELNDFIVSKIKKSAKIKNPLPPFTTSTLQQDAYKKLNYTTKRTMSIAQQLYEGIDVPGHGTVGLITYMRTDSVRIAKEAQDMASEYIKKQYGDNYAPKTPREFKSKKNIQDAHEAIRPSHIDMSPDMLKGALKDEQYKLYSLIWNRFLASQMESCEIDATSIDVRNGDYLFRANGQVVKFDGFMKVYDYLSDDEENNSKIPKVEENDNLIKKSIDKKQHFTQPPARFSEATLVKCLEDNGIGRPSTYAPTISTLLSRKYVQKDKKAIVPTELGEIVNSIISEYFKQIADVEFTANIEQRLDNVEDGKEEWSKTVSDFFEPLKGAIEMAEKELAKITIEDKVSDIPCEKCGKLMVIKEGRFGRFLACPGYPECKNTKPINEELDVKCPKCAGKVIIRRSKKGRTFYGCSNYPDCDFVSWLEPTNEVCPKCGTYMVKKVKKNKELLICANEECKHQCEKKEDAQNNS